MILTEKQLKEQINGTLASLSVNISFRHNGEIKFLLRKCMNPVRSNGLCSVEWCASFD